MYVVNNADNTLSVINGSTNKVIATIPVGNFPFDVAVDSLTDRIYVTDDFDNAVSVISGQTNKVTGTVSGVSGPFAIAVNQKTNRIYVTTLKAIPRIVHGVAVINGQTHQVVARIAVSRGVEGNVGIAADPLTNVIYTTVNSANSVAAINGQTSRIIATAPVGRSPSGVAVNPLTNRIYVADTGNGKLPVLTGRP